jgi:ppGpp synthetase/RelA/SpoT-type nucleotidyltranferase
MTLDEYEKSGKQPYEELAKLVASLLSEAIAKRGEMRLQHVQHRAKGVTSLRDKLVKEKVAPEDREIETKIKDLAGCRLVFYTNTDVGRFRGSGLLNELFEIDWDRTKFHHPVDESSGQFRSDNIVVRLKEPLVSKAEYVRFKGLACEVQVQTALNHAWSEMEHDVYKQPALKGFGAARMRSIKERMEKIMKKHLLPAGYEFSKIRDDFDKLAAGKALFDQDALRMLEAATDNNKRYELLEQFSTYVLPDYDDISAVQDDIRNSVARVIRAANSTARQPIETEFGNLDGMTVEHVFDKGMDIVDTIRYAGPDSVERTFELLCELYRDAGSDEQRKRVLRSADELAKNELDVWTKAGPIVQHILADRVLEIDLEKAGPIRPVLLKVLGELLNPEVTGTSSTYKTFTWKTQAANPSDALISIRTRAIQALQKMFLSSRSDGERREVIQTLSEASRTPNRDNYSDGLLHIVLTNTLDIVRFYGSHAKNLSYELLQALEHDFLWLYRRNREMPADAQRDPSIREVKDKLTKEILSFRDQVNRDEGFVTYKTLVGFESVFPPAWDNDDFEVKEEQACRDREIDQILERIEDGAAGKWLGVIRRCVQTKSNDLATFPNFGKFLEKLAAKKPAIALKYLEKIDEELEPIIPALLAGLEVSAPDAVKRKIGEWIDARKYLGRILWFYRFSPGIDLNTVKRAAAVALETGEERAITNAVEVAVTRYKDLGGDIIDSVLLPAIDWLEKHGHRYWGGLFMVHGKDSPFQHLTEQQARRVLAHLVSRETIDTRLDYLLAAIGKTHPNMLVDFLGNRVRRERELKADRYALARYDAIPFQFHKANEVLKKAPDYMLEQMRAWYREDDDLFSLRAGRLAHSVYQRVTPELSAPLMRLVETGSKENIEFVLELLERFESSAETHPLYRAIISKLPVEDPLWSSVRAGMEATGVVSGEFGMAEAYKERRAAVAAWLEDADEKVRRFAKKHVAQLDRMIASEQRRAEEDLEARKRSWGTGAGDEKDS